MKRLLALLAVLLLSAISIIPVLGIKDPPGATHLIYGASSEAITLDPAWSCDIRSDYLIFNVYDTLIKYNGESPDEFRPGLATSWTVTDIDETSPEGLHWIAQYDFTIRSGAQFHTGGTVQPSDVEYSIERGMVQDRIGGPQWMFYLPLLDGYSSRDFDVGNATHPGPEVWLMGMMIDHAITSDNVAGTVTIKAVNKFDWIWQVLSHPVGSIMSKAWAVSIGDWPGTWGDYTGWIAYNNPATSPIDLLPTYPPPWWAETPPIDGGAGPFSVDYWNKGVEYSLYGFGDYWNGWPASWPVPGSIAPASNLTRVTVKTIEDWASKKPMFLAGDLDFCDVPRVYINDPELTSPSIQVTKPLGTLRLGSLNFNFQIAPSSPYMPEMPIGTPKTDFFGDIHIRKALAYAFNYTKYIDETWLGEAVQPNSWHIEGLPGPTIPEHYYCDFDKAMEEFKLAFGGSLSSPGPAWTQGFQAIIVYDTGSIERRAIGHILEANIESLYATANPGVTVDIIPVGVPSFQYYGSMKAKELPVFVVDWQADYIASDNLVRSHIHSLGALAYFQSYSNATVDAMIDTAVKLPSDDPIAQQYYWELQLEYYRSIPAIPIYQPLERHYEQAWVQGWYYNVMYPGYPGDYYYSIWKQDITEGNVNYDSIVDMRDVGAIGRAFASYPGHQRWNFRCDVNGDRKVDMKDIGVAARNFGQPSPPP